MTESLRKVVVRGPGHPTETDTESRPFWNLRAFSPNFGLKQVKPSSQAVIEDDVFPVRALLIDPVSSRDASYGSSRLPRLLSMHLLAGAKWGDSYFSPSSDPGYLDLRIGPKPHHVRTLAARSNETKAEFKTFDPDVRDPDRAGFHHVVVEPLQVESAWPGVGEKPDFVQFPTCRLVGGAVEIVALPASLQWMGDLAPRRPGTLNVAGDGVVFTLTPDGIELDADLPFPGVGKLRGRVLVTPTADGVRARLLPEKLDNAAAWMEAWRRVVPSASGDEDELTGLRLAAAELTLPPAFVWHARLTEKQKEWSIAPLASEVEVPGTALGTRLFAPGGPRGNDGEVTLAPSVYRLSTLRPAQDAGGVPLPAKGWPKDAKGTVLLLTAELLPVYGTGDTTPRPGTRLLLSGSADRLDVKLESMTDKPREVHELAYDGESFAREIRRAQGLDEPAPGLRDPERPLLAAFVPLDDGWLQLPVPNLPPIDPTKDEPRAVGGAPLNVLSGYLRFSRVELLPGVLSAFGRSAAVGPLPSEAPWMVTVEGTHSLSFAAAITPGAPGATGRLERFGASLDHPELSTRGLLWISADRPDAFEALPRLGAGPGAFLDVPLETTRRSDAPGVMVSLSDLVIHVERVNGRHEVSRDRVEVSIAPRPMAGWASQTDEQRAEAVLTAARDVLLTSGSPSPKGTLPLVVWRRHPRMPLAATMPMTRSVASAVRPLESRDLVPFTITLGRERLRMAWERAAVFPILTVAGAPPGLRPVAGWPWPRNAGADSAPEQGVGLSAFGVPGAELALDPAKTVEGEWKEALRWALRYDLPALDEAFASATLPPVPGDAQPGPAEPVLPAAVAYDWPAIHRLWLEQARRHQLTRVAGSYLAPQSALGTKGSGIRELVGGVTWKSGVEFQAPPEKALVPYGAAKIDGGLLSGDDALRGPDGLRFRVAGKELQITADSADLPETIDVVGYAPSSYLDGALLRDARRAGSGAAERSESALWRPVNLPDASAVSLLVTLRAPAEVRGVGRLWFRDLPVDADGKHRAPEGVEFRSWQDSHLRTSGFEWRLLPPADPSNPASSNLGRDRIPFFGFELEPLRLVEWELELDTRGGKPTGAVLGAKLLGRLHLGRAGAGLQQDDNLVELTLSRAGGVLGVSSLTAPAPLRFALQTSEARPRRVRVEVTGCAWKSGAPELTGVSLVVTMFGAEHTFGDAAIGLSQPSGSEVVASWPKSNRLVAPPDANHGSLVVSRIELTTGPGRAAELQLERQLRLTPHSPAGEWGRPADAAITVDLQGDQVVAVRLLGMSITTGAPAEGTGASAPSLSFHAEDEALTLTLAARSLPPQPLLPGLELGGDLALGLVARVEKAVGGVMQLTAGWLDGELVGDPGVSLITSAITRIAFQAECARRIAPAADEVPNRWTGALRWYGALRLQNAIGWPNILNAGEDAPIPWPGGSPNDGRTTVRIDPDPATALDHAVAYHLAGHAMAFDLAAGLREMHEDAMWVAPVTASHTFRAPGDVAAAARTFHTVETIAMGPASAIVPAVPPAPYDRDPYTFAPRYRYKVESGTGKKNDYAIGMLEAGIGRIAVVLRGALGIPFRDAFWNAPAASRSGLFIAGGFVGLVGSEADGSAPLLRLPLLAALDPTNPLARGGVIAQRLGGNVEVAWMDSHAARDVAFTARSAVTPSSSSEGALRAALVTGSRPLSAAGVDTEATIAAVLVEQSFAVGSESMRELATSPFFIAAAVSLRRTLLRLGWRTNPTVLSLVAGRGTQPDGKGRRRRTTLAAAVVLRSEPGARVRDEATEDLASRVATVEEDLVLRAYSGPPVEVAGESLPLGAVAGPAFADHTRPRASLLRSVDGAGRRVYVRVPLPRARERVRFGRPVDRPAFPDAGRGYPLGIGGEADGWLGGVEEGRMRPFRDELHSDPADPEPSGAAGLSRVVALPGQAASVPPSGGPTLEALHRGLIWFAQTRAPVYLPLPWRPLTAPAIPWLSPAMARPRLPASAALEVLLRRLAIDPHESGNRAMIPAQPILPDLLSISSVGDRAGILLARISRLETALPHALAFDLRYPRYGVPAQASAASVRTERTPRPGPIPANTGVAERDRRPAASRVLPGAPLAALAGPADTVSGDLRAGDLISPWSVTFVAAPEWEGAVTDRWDGTIPVVAEIDVALSPSGKAVLESPVAALLRLLFPTTVEGNAVRTHARAALLIGGELVPVLRLHILRYSPGSGFDRWVNREGVEVASRPGAGDPPASAHARRGTVRLVLDARGANPTRAPGSPDPAIFAALARPGLANVELQLTVYPGFHPLPGNIPDGATPIELTQTGGTPGTPAALPVGESRAPLTLRLPLSPVLRERGALPLAPTSVLFTDPAYDAALSSEPMQDRQRLAATVAAGGPLPAHRGALVATLYADRRRVNPRGSVTLMVDVAFEKPAVGVERFMIEAATSSVEQPKFDGDLAVEHRRLYRLAVAVVARGGGRRDLFVDRPSDTPVSGYTPPGGPLLELARVYELPLAMLVERDGTAAAIEAGETLEIRTTDTADQIPAGDQKAVTVVFLADNRVATATLAPAPGTSVSRQLHLVVTDEPVVPPPSALYAALVRRGSSAASKAPSLSLPLYAQGPLPSRIDLLDAKAGFRAGLLRRTASFVWTLSRPASEREHAGVHVVKIDRNGQTHLPPADAPDTELDRHFIRARILDPLSDDRGSLTALRTPPDRLDLPALGTDAGVMARMMIAESINPGYASYDYAEVERGLQAMKAVVVNRLKDPGKFAAPGARTWSDIITAPGQWHGFKKGASGKVEIDKSVTDRIDEVLKKANSGTPGTYHEFVQLVLDVTDRAVKDPFAALTEIGGVKVTGGSYGWRTKGASGPGGSFVAIPESEKGVIANNQFYTLKK